MRDLKQLAQDLYEALDCRGGVAMIYIQSALDKAAATASVEEHPRDCKQPCCRVIGPGDSTKMPVGSSPSGQAAKRHEEQQKARHAAERAEWFNQGLEVAAMFCEERRWTTKEVAEAMAQHIRSLARGR